MAGGERSRKRELGEREREKSRIETLREGVIGNISGAEWSRRNLLHKLWFYLRRRFIFVIMRDARLRLEREPDFLVQMFQVEKKMPRNPRESPATIQVLALRPGHGYADSGRY